MTDNHNTTTAPLGEDVVEDLIEFLNDSPVNFFAIDSLTRRLKSCGFNRLDQRDAWPQMRPGQRSFIVKNDSACFAFIVGTGAPDAGFRIISAHSDSPGFRVKPKSEMPLVGGALRLNTEVYGGPILYTWFDRPLSLVGRVILRSDNPLAPTTRLVRFHNPLLTIPHLAIHFNRAVNDGNKLSKQKDMLPVIALLNDKLEAEDFLLRMIAEKLGVDKKEILDFDMMLYDTTPAMLVGPRREMLTSGRIDDLSMVHAAMTALTEEADTDCAMTRVIAIFDNEETGSGTKQGAASPILDQLLRRLVALQGGTEEDYMRAIDRSFMVSADNAHAIHPNYADKQDPTNHPRLGGGPVIKYNANCKYMTDAESGSVFRRICELAGVPVQTFVNHSDVAGGSTLGNILTSQIPLRGVDMGAGIWAMHSVRETASAEDHRLITRAFRQFFAL
ncbi:MAG: M18 family aminopeptidase [Clostridium sp.]|nr:M18 family aminopeptidase [Clostridium sp.]